MLGAVLVGGRSRRMGTPKSLVEVDGVPMAQRVAAALEGAGAGNIVAVGPRELAAGLAHLADEHPGEGPLGGIITALRAAGAEPALVVACDMPWMTAEALRHVVRAAADDAGASDVVVAVSDRVEPLCALWRPSALDGLVECFTAGERAVHRAIERLEARSVELPRAVLRNANTPHDLGTE